MKKSCLIFGIVFSLLLMGCNTEFSAIHNNVTPPDGIQNEELSVTETRTFTNNLFCGKNIEILSGWEIILESTNQVTIKTNKKDTAGYDVYIKLWDQDGRNIIKGTFQGDSTVTKEKCLQGICYGIKINDTSKCPIDTTIYTEQPGPTDLEYPWYPTIDSYDHIENKLTEMLELNF